MPWGTAIKFSFGDKFFGIVMVGINLFFRQKIKHLFVSQYASSILPQGLGVKLLDRILYTLKLLQKFVSARINFFFCWLNFLAIRDFPKAKRYSYAPLRLALPFAPQFFLILLYM